LRFCDGGCVDGPGKNRELTHLSKRNMIIRYNNSNIPYRTAAHYRDAQPPDRLDRSFSDKALRLPAPKADDIRRILHSTGKFTQGDELNCRACGYNSCREHAVAVFQGLADLGMCLPFNLRSIEEDRGRLMQKYELVSRELDKQLGEDMIIGDDRDNDEVVGLIRQVGPTPTTVLIRGETGTGKELTARAIHRLSARADKPLVTVNCTTLADSLLESELFGHKRELLPAPSPIARDFSRQPTAVPSSWTRLAISPRNYRLNCCACWMLARCVRWVEPWPSGLMCA